MAIASLEGETVKAMHACERECEYGRLTVPETMQD